MKNWKMSTRGILTVTQGFCAQKCQKGPQVVIQTFTRSSLQRFVIDEDALNDSFPPTL